MTQTTAAPTAQSEDVPVRSGDVSQQTDTAAQMVHTLASRAASELLSGDSERYLTLFSHAASLPPSRRYQAVKEIFERGLAATRGRQGEELLGLLVVLARAVVEQLEVTPAEPVLLNYAGVVFYELWALDAARAMFLAARRLDSELPNLHANVEAVRSRKRTQTAQLRGRRAGWMHPALADLNRRAVKLAPRARPATGLRVSLCMIVKDEEEMLGRCLAAAAPAMDEIIVVDTGSTDRTIEIAHQYGALVIERAWTGSFSEARNASFDAATGDWILYLDADEVLLTDDAGALRGLIGQTWREAFFLHETNYSGHEEAGTAVVHRALRLFRNRPDYRFEGRLHEQILQTLPIYLPERIAQSAVRVEHFGYLGSVRAAKEKSTRNVELLLAARSENASLSAFDHFNLGSEYMALDQHRAAAEEFERAWRLRRDSQGDGAHFVPALATRLTTALRGAGRSDLALERVTEALDRFPDFTDLVYQLGLVNTDLGLADAARAAFERCIEMGEAPSLYTSVVGSGTFLPRIALAEQHLQAGDVTGALALLRWCAEHHGAFFGTYRPYVLALLASGCTPEAAVAEINGGLGEQATSMIRFIIAAALVERGAPAVAAQQLRLVLDARPTSVPAIELLLETLLLVRDFEAFGVEVERLAATGLPERDRRERLAQMYLRHGFLRSAAKEWLAVVDRQPDEAALRGLAEVALRNGQNEAAKTFSAQALKYATV